MGQNAEPALRFQEDLISGLLERPEGGRVAQLLLCCALEIRNLPVAGSDYLVCENLDSGANCLRCWREVLAAIVSVLTPRQGSFRTGKHC